MTIPMSPVEQVQAQLARQKWAVDTRDAELLAGLYTADSAPVDHLGAVGRVKAAQGLRVAGVDRPLLPGKLRLDLLGG